MKGGRETHDAIVGIEEDCKNTLFLCFAGVFFRDGVVVGDHDCGVGCVDWEVDDVCDVGGGKENRMWERDVFDVQTLGFCGCDNFAHRREWHVNGKPQTLCHSTL